VNDATELATQPAEHHAQPVPRRLFRRTSRALLATVGLLALAGCASDAPLDTFKPKGPEAQTIQDLAVPVFLVAGVVFVLVLGGILVLSLKYRDRTHGEDPVEPRQTHGVIPLELGWTIVPALILAVIAPFTVATILDLAREPEGPEVIDVTVIGQQWWWEYQYDLDDDGEADIITANEMVIPADTPVNLSIESRDVIHSFWIPALNGKKDAVPGRTHELTIQADDPGQYRGQCTEFCGLSHANMRMRVYAVDQAEYDDWVAGQLAPAPVPEEGSPAAAGQQAFIQACSSCHVINGLEPEDFAGAPLVSGAAPNLTHFMSRTTFAGSIFDLYLPPDGDEDAQYLDIIEDGEFNRAQLEAWLRDPPGEKPMAPQPNEYSDGLGRGMPNLNLSESQIDELVAYLETLE
jgi:cytochrome c oxidase subunit II